LIVVVIACVAPKDLSPLNDEESIVACIRRAGRTVSFLAVSGCLWLSLAVSGCVCLWLSLAVSG